MNFTISWMSRIGEGCYGMCRRQGEEILPSLAGGKPLSP